MKLVSCALSLLLLLGACSGKDRPVTSSHEVLLVPIGPVSADLLAHLQREIPSRVKRRVRIGTEIPRPNGAFDASRRQYRGDALLEELRRREFPDADRVVGIIDADAYAPGLNFIFGQARNPGRFAVVALPRLRDSFRGRPENEARFQERVLKEAVHEIGHTFGFGHCPDPRCVMHFSNSFGDTDRKSARFCRVHRIPS